MRCNFHLSRCISFFEALLGLFWLAAEQNTELDVPICPNEPKNLLDLVNKYISAVFEILPYT